MLVEHHVKYKEIHGVDETVFMTTGDHHALHSRLRKAGKCKVPVGDLNKISKAAYKRTEKGRVFDYEYCKKYRLKNISSYIFDKNMMSNIMLRESWRYNKSVDSIKISSHFVVCNGKKIYYLGEK